MGWAERRNRMGFYAAKLQITVGHVDGSGSKLAPGPQKPPTINMEVNFTQAAESMDPAAAVAEIVQGLEAWIQKNYGPIVIKDKPKLELQ